MTKMANREVEYKEAMLTRHYMYETRHKLFGFTITLNAAFSAAVFHFADTGSARIALAILCVTITALIALFARRSNQYLIEVDNYLIELEKLLAFELVTKTHARLSKGLSSTAYLFACYCILIIFWIGFLSYELAQMTFAA